MLDKHGTEQKYTFLTTGISTRNLPTFLDNVLCAKSKHTRLNVLLEKKLKNIFMEYFSNATK